MRLFYLYRIRDRSGISGTGWVAEGVVFTSGRCALTCLDGKKDTIHIHDDLESITHSYCDGKDTIIIHDDTDAVDSQGRVWVFHSTGYHPADKTLVPEWPGIPWWPGQVEADKEGLVSPSQYLAKQREQVSASLIRGPRRGDP